MNVDGYLKMMDDLSLAYASAVARARATYEGAVILIPPGDDIAHARAFITYENSEAAAFHVYNAARARSKQEVAL